MPTQAVRSSSFVGRQTQLEFLAQRRKAAVLGEGSIVIVAGEAGAGKTRLVSEFCTSLNLAEARVCVGHCLDYIQVPYAPFLEAIESLATAAPAVLAAAPQISEALGNLIPQLRRVPESRPVEVLDKLRQFDMIARAIGRFGQDRLTVVVIEDLHWADAGTLELLQHVSGSLSGSRLLLVATYRSDELSRDHPLRSVLAKLERNRPIFQIIVPPLSRGQVHTLLMHGLRHRDKLSGAAVEAICARAEGNPLFAEELLKGALTGIDVLGARPPTTIQEAVRDRLRQASAEDTPLLARAAVIGRRFEPSMLAQISGKNLEQIIPTLKRAKDLGLIIEQTNARIHYAFRHELQRQALLAELLAVEMQDAHCKIAAILEADKVEDHTIELAHHWWEGREFDKATAYNERAGDRAASVFAYRNAIIDYERALDATNDALSAARLQLKLSRALMESGLSERAAACAEAALQTYAERKANEDAGQTCVWLAKVRLVDGDWLGSERLAQRALHIVGSNPASPVFFAAHTYLLWLKALNRWKLEEARPHIEAAQRFTGEPPPEDVIRFQEAMAAIEACSGNAEAAVARIHKAAGLAESTCSLPRLLSCWSSFGAGMDQIGESRIGAQALETAFKIMRNNDLSGLGVAETLIYGAHAKLRAGRLSEAVDLIEEALAAGIDMPVFLLNVAQVAIPVGLLLDLDKLVVPCADDGLVEYGVQSSEVRTVACSAPYAELWAAQGKADAARLLIRRAIDALDALDTLPGPGDGDELFVAAARFGDDADVERARAYLERIVKSSNVRATPGNLALVEAYQAAREEKHQGKVGKNDRRSVGLAERAAQLFQDIGWPLLEAQALELAGNDDDALRIYRNFGDAFDSRRVEAKLGSRRRGRAPTELTTREQELLGLLVAGKSNRAIAEALVISERTVENHVSSILAKYAVGSRAELIAKHKASTEAQ